MRAKKSYGQHFLHNEPVAKKIIDSLDYSYSNFLEIGPGQGVLTKHILEKESIRFKAIDADVDMIQYLKKTYPEHEDCFIKENFLKSNIADYFDSEDIVLFGNYPYNISSQIIFKMLENKERIPLMVGMFQKEVAERIVSKPGSKVYGVISVLTQAWYSGKILFHVSPGSFNPPPKVQSSVIKLNRNEKKSLGCDEKLFKQVVKNSFGQRRKMLRNTLKSMINDETILQKDVFTYRPEKLNVEDFIELTKIIENQN